MHTGDPRTRAQLKLEHQRWTSRGRSSPVRYRNCMLGCKLTSYSPPTPQINTKQRKVHKVRSVLLEFVLRLAEFMVFFFQVRKRNIQTVTVQNHQLSHTRARVLGTAGEGGVRLKDLHYLLFVDRKLQLNAGSVSLLTANVPAPLTFASLPPNFSRCHISIHI